jgi:hypothetical protein
MFIALALLVALHGLISLLLTTSTDNHYTKHNQYVSHD